MFFHKLVAFRSFIEMPMLGFEKDVMSLLRKMEARREYSLSLRAKRKSIRISRFVRELQRLEYSVGYKNSSKNERGCGRSS